MAYTTRYTLCLFTTVLVVSVKAAPLEGLSRTVPFLPPDVRLTPEGLTRVTLPACEPDVQAGRPVLPVAGVSFEIPAGFEVAAVTLTPGAIREFPLAAPVEWGQPPAQPGEKLPAAPPDPAIYQAEAPYPDYARPLWRADPLHATTLLSVQVHPVRFDPARRALLAAENLIVSVALRPSAPPDASLLLRGTLGAASPLSTRLPDESHTYVIISASNLLYHAPAPWNFQALCQTRARAGFTPALVSTEWIYANYEGVNPAAKIRAFVQDACQRWGLRYLLLGGTFDLIPVQKLDVSFSDFFTTRTAEIPADAIYYGCLDGSYDNNGNGRYGEVSDGVNGGDVDLTAEVMVGRFPVADAAELAHMVRKTLRYENATAQELAPNALIAEKMDLGSQIYATGFMEEIRLGSTAYGINTLGFENSNYADAFNTDSTLYDSDARLWTTDDALAFLNQNFQTLNHLGHGATKQCMKLSLSQPAGQAALRALTNEMPYFIYSQTCSAGAFDTPDCFAEQIVTVSNAAGSAIMNAREGWEYGNVVGGYSHRFHRCFWDAALRGTATRLGEINEQSRRMNLHMLGSSSANYWRWVYYELNLFGDPATPFAAAVNLTPPVITHAPPANTYDTQTTHRVTCTVEPIGLFDPDAVTLAWQTDREPGLVRTQALTRLEGNLYEGFMPPQPADTRIAYALSARNHAGIESRWPAAGDASFCVTRRLALDIRGSPFDYGTSTPDYGTHYFASGLVASASVTSLHPITDSTRYRNTGFFGTGSAPQSGTNPSVAFRIDTSSLLVWNWQLEHRLDVFSDNSAFPTQTFWASADGTCPVPPAPPFVSNSTVYAFAEWRLDGARAPAAPGYCSPDFGALLMDAPRTLEARYLPAALDADGNGIPDWWEFRFFGESGHDPDADADGDGYTLLDEYNDLTDPLVASLIPAPPRISHTSLDEIQTRPGPFAIQAVITDTRAIESAYVRWRRKTETWQLTPMLPTSNSVFSAQIGAVSEPGDDFEYQLIASDPAGRTSQTDLSFFFLRFPAVDASRFGDLAFVALPTQTIVSQYMNLYNTGNAELMWTLRLARVESILSTNLPCWNRQSLGQPWHVVTNRAASAPYALFSHLVSTSSLTAPVRSSITLPPVQIGEGAALSFKYWINSEIHNNTTRAFDGGIVEYSKDDGATFQQLKGPYTHTIYGWASSPWPDGTPCLAGNGSEGWRTATFDLLKEYPELNGFQGRVIHFRFHYGGDNNTDNEGWYIDDVTVLPLQLQAGFLYSLEPSYDFTVAAGDYRRILWFNRPANMDVRDDNLTVFISSNDPVTPLIRFNWQLKIRDYPRLTDLSAAQTATGDGLVSLASGVCDDDGEPVSLAVHWSPDNGKSWSAAALTQVSASAGAVPSEAVDGRLAGLSTSSNALHVTNAFRAAWASRLVAPPLTVSTQVLFRVTATNGYFGRTYTTARLTVDNVPPSFLPGALAFSPLSAVGPYALTTNLLALTWPAATDTPSGSALTYRLTGLALTNSTPLTTAALALSNSLDTAHLYHVVALDPCGNASPPLTAACLVLDACGDYDGDGLRTADEELAGLSALDPNQHFKINFSPLTSKEGLFTLSWNSVLGRRYTVEAAPTLLPPAWQPVAALADIEGTGGPLTVDLPVNGPSLFFRVLVRKP
jgi:hypothetical protein